jgi:hypothetical protein
MKIRQLVLLSLLIALVTSCGAPSLSTSELPKGFQATIPSELSGGLKLEGLEDRCDGCKLWRYIDYYSNDGEEAIKREKVSVQAGYRAMYAYPGTHYFSNTKIEKSASGSYKRDKAIVLDALQHEYNRKKERISTYLKENPDLVEKMAPHKAKGRDYITFEQGTVNGYEYFSYTENVIGLLGNTVSQVHILVPEQEIIITAYLLRQEKSKFKNIEEFLKLKGEFIESYTAFLKTHST